MPSLRVKLHSVPSALCVPVSVAASGTRLVPSFRSAEYLYWVSVRLIVALKKAMSSPM
jgi:hypothetical protein